MPRRPSNLRQLSSLADCPSVVFGLEGLQPEGFLPDATVDVCLSYVRALAIYRPDCLVGVRIDPNFEVDWLESRLPRGVPVLVDQDHVTGLAPSVFHVSSLLADRSARSLWPLWARSPSVALAVSVHDDLTRQALEYPAKDPAGRLQASRHRLLVLADAVIASSHSSRMDAVGWGGVDPDKVFVVHQPFDDPEPPRDEPLRLRAEPVRGIDGAFGSISFALQRQFLLAAASPSSSMHNEVLVRAFASIDPAVRAGRKLLLASRRDHASGMAQLKEAITSLGMQDQVLVATGVSEESMKHLYRSCLITLVGGVEAGSVQAALEAAAAGSGIVVADHDAFLELVPQPDARFYPMAVDSTASMLRRCLIDTEFCAARKAETAEALAGYSAAGTAAALRDAYKFAAASRPRRAFPARAAAR